MKFLIFLLLWTLVFVVGVLVTIKFIRRHEKVYILLILNCLYLSVVFWSYTFLILKGP